MRLDAIQYYLKEAFKCVRKNRLTTVASIGTTVATLLILGVFIALTFNISSFADQFSRNCEIQVFIGNEIDEAGYDAIGGKIKNIKYVEEVEKYTKAQIFEEVKLKFKDKAEILEGLENDNPFRNSFKVRLSDLSKSATVVDSITKIEGVVNTTDFQQAAGAIVKTVKSIKTISLWLVIILCIVSAFIISNAVKVSVYSRRKEINIMKYIGATDWFIRWPFIIEGIIIGIYGALITFVVEWLIYMKVYSSFNYPTFEMIPFAELAPMLIGVFAGVGAIIGAIGSTISVRKHLKV